MWFRRPDPAHYWRQPPAPGAALHLRFLGTAGFEVRYGAHVLVLDPFLTRPGLFTTLFRRLRTDEALLERVLPQANDVLVGHAHYDHVLDAPALCRRTGARLIGSPDVALVGQAAGLPAAQILATSGGEDIASGPFRLRGLPSRHGKVYLGRVPLPGSIRTPPAWPPRLRALRHGLVLNWYLECPAGRVVHVDSADWVADSLEGLKADVLCLCAIGWTQRPRYVEGIIERLRPRFVLPCHWDLFTRRLEASPRVLPGCRLGEFVQAISAMGATPVTLPLLGEFGL